MRAWCDDTGQWSYKHGQHTYPFTPGEPSERLAYVSCLHGTPPLDEMFAAEINQGLLYLVGASGRYLMLDATGRTWRKSRDEAVSQETKFLIRLHQATKRAPSKSRPRHYKSSQSSTAKAETSQQAEKEES